VIRSGCQGGGSGLVVSHSGSTDFGLSSEAKGGGEVVRRGAIVERQAG